MKWLQRPFRSAVAHRSISTSGHPIDVRPSLRRDLPWIIAIAAVLQASAVVVAFRYGFDSHAYWMAWRDGLYAAAPNVPDAYLYSPAFAQLMWPLVQLPWPVFATVYSLVLLGALVWLVRPLPRNLAIPLGIAGLNEVMAGNVFLIFAVVVVLGFQHPGGWAFVALTKLTPCVGPVWFLVRRDWRHLAISSLVTAAVVLVSVGISPRLWADWLHFLSAYSGQTSGSLGSSVMPPLTLRLPIALILVVWGALKNRQWTLPVAMVVATHVFGLAACAVLLALPRMYGPNRVDRVDLHRERPDQTCGTMTE